MSTTVVPHKNLYNVPLTKFWTVLINTEQKI